MSNYPLQVFFNKYDLVDIAKDKKELFSINGKSTVQEALDELAKRKVLSLPLKDHTGKFFGFISISDIVIALMFNPAFAKFGKEGVDKIEKKDIEAILKRSVLKNPVEDLVGISEESKNFWAFDEKEKLTRVFEYFSQGVHRALVTRKNKPPCVISQSDAVKFIYSKLDQEKNVGKLIEKPLSALGTLYNVRVLAVKTTESALCGFRRLLQWKSFRDWNLAALPVVDEQGHVVANLSETDLRGTDEGKLLDVLLPVMDYLTLIHGKPRKPITATKDTKFSVAIKKLIDENVHRLWIVDKKNNPVGVLSLSDVIAKFTVFDWPHLRAYENDYNMDLDPKRAKKNKETADKP